VLSTRAGSSRVRPRSKRSREAGAVPARGRTTRRHRRTSTEHLCSPQARVAAAVIVAYLVALAFAAPHGRLAVALVTVGGYLLALAANLWLSRHGR